MLSARSHSALCQHGPDSLHRSPLAVSTRAAAARPLCSRQQLSGPGRTPANMASGRRRALQLVAAAEGPESQFAATTTVAPERRVAGGNVLIACDDPLSANACVSWVLSALVHPGHECKVHLLHCLPPGRQQEQPAVGSAEMPPFGEERPPAGHEGGTEYTEQDMQLLQCELEMQQLLGARLQQAQVPYAVHAVHEPLAVSGKTGRIGSVLCRWAADLDATATVLASKSRGGLPELFRGSVANYVTHHSKRPVVVLHVPPAPGAAGCGFGTGQALSGSGFGVGGEAGGGLSRTIVVAIDDSEQSDEVCRWTLQHLYTRGDNLHLVHVIPCLPLTTEMPPFEGSSVLGTSLPQEQMEREEAAWKETQASRFKAMMEEADVPHTFDLLTETTQDPVTTIGQSVCEVASRLRAKAVVCGARKHSGLAEMLFNSVENYVAHHCPQPVVLLPNTWQ